MAGKSAEQLLHEFRSNSAADVAMWASAVPIGQDQDGRQDTIVVMGHDEATVRLHGSGR